MDVLRLQSESDYVSALKEVSLFFNAKPEAAVSILGLLVAVENYEAKRFAVFGDAHTQLRADARSSLLTYLKRYMSRVISPSSADRWITQPKRFLDGLSPYEAVAKGKGAQVIERLEQAKNGFF
ncbi:hypothetical protein ACGFZ7_15710 [Pseudomonas sp. NPDC047963]|nr:hypothetical protein [Pseudomonas sp.]